MTASEVEYEYLEKSRVALLLPSRGAVTGGSLVSVTGSGFREAGLRCRFGTEEVHGAQFVSSTVVACVAPGSMSGVGTVAVEVSVNDGSDFTSDRVEFLYETIATVTSVRPSVGVSGTSDQVVTVVGEHFARSSDLICRFGLNETVRAMFLTSSTISCLAPSRGPGVVYVSVASSRFEPLSSSSPFRYISASSHSLSPSSGPLSGGSLVTYHSATLTQGKLPTSKYEAPHLAPNPKLQMLNAEPKTPTLNS
jgi:hypothetical protein